MLTDAHVIDPGQHLPLDDRSVDLVLTDHVFEHITDPFPVAAELRRSLRVGGRICARTPMKWGYIAAAATMVPNGSHAAVLRIVQPNREERDIFPTAYRLNTRSNIARAFPTTEFEHVIYGWDPEATYVGQSTSLEALIQAGGRVTPERFRPTLLAFLRRQGSPESNYAASR
ncbi:MAG: methyltransferase domain-containing protein [Solirubrobacteraceae bacterium]